MKTPPTAATESLSKEVSNKWDVARQTMEKADGEAQEIADLLTQVHNMTVCNHKYHSIATPIALT